jgi:hypothetical protein
MTINRDDWGSRFDSRGNDLVPAMPSPDAVLKEMQTGDGRPSAATQAAFAEHNATTPVPASKPRDPETGRYIQRADWNYDRTGREISTASDNDLPPNLVRDMHSSADGFDSQLAQMKTTAQRILADMPQNFAAHFDTLSPSIQEKAYRTMRDYPHLDIYALIDRVQPQLTLSEMDEAQRWIRKLNNV